jgi:4-hydroxy-3-polyprenylbenzoate decarboxylase
MKPVMNHKQRIILAVTGASGMPYAHALAKALGDHPDVELFMIVSSAAAKVLAAESGATAADLASHAHKAFGEQDIGAPPASGSWRHAGMIVCPCSMATLGKIASGIGDSLITRAADVCLKERRPLILVPRETPLNRVHMDNMLRAHDAGAVIMPASPGFYLRPDSLETMFAQFAGRVLDQIGLPTAPSGRWGE